MQVTFEKLHAKVYSIEGQWTGDTIHALTDACARAELAPLLRDVRFRLGGSSQSLFHSLPANILELSPEIDAQSPSTLALHLRFALELHLWRRLMSRIEEPIYGLAAAIAACHTAVKYYGTLTISEKSSVLRELPGWLSRACADVHDGEAEGRNPREIATLLAAFREELLRLYGIAGHDCPAWSDESLAVACALAARVLALSAPAEFLLTKGGDNRLAVNEQTGLNQYGCSPKPRPWAVTFASCTASSISDLGYQEAEQLRQRLLQVAVEEDLSACLDGELERVRNELAELLHLDRLPGTEIILTASGTDAELHALVFALGNHERQVLNILIAPTEVGSGTLPAASGLHFDPCTPGGISVEPGAPLAGLPAGRVRVEALHLRTESGSVLPAEELDIALVSLVDTAVAAGEVVLLHLLDSSKTGLCAPQMEVVCKLKHKHGNAMLVLVDAAQMRVGLDELETYIESEFMILCTGSKFFTGPPFCGALIVPCELAQRAIDTLPSFPNGFAAYATQSDYSVRWSRLVACLPKRPNLGLLLRWRAALAEMHAFFSVLPKERYATLADFATAMLAEIATRPELRLVSTGLTNRQASQDPLPWGRLPTIFSFLVLRADGVPLDYDEARRVYSWLNADIAGLLPSGASKRERAIAATCCHIGQPVRIQRIGGQWRAALRIASGARMVSLVRYHPRLGGTPQQRLASQINDARTVLEKISLIVRYWDDLVAAPYGAIEGGGHRRIDKGESKSPVSKPVHGFGNTKRNAKHGDIPRFSFLDGCFLFFARGKTRCPALARILASFSHAQIRRKRLPKYHTYVHLCGRLENQCNSSRHES